MNNWNFEAPMSAHTQVNANSWELTSERSQLRACIWMHLKAHSWTARVNASRRKPGTLWAHEARCESSTQWKAGASQASRGEQTFKRFHCLSFSIWNNRQQQLPTCCSYCVHTSPQRARRFGKRTPEHKHTRSHILFCKQKQFWKSMIRTWKSTKNFPEKLLTRRFMNQKDSDSEVRECDLECDWECA